MYIYIQCILYMYIQYIIFFKYYNIYIISIIYIVIVPETGLRFPTFPCFCPSLSIFHEIKRLFVAVLCHTRCGKHFQLPGGRVQEEPSNLDLWPEFRS